MKISLPKFGRLLSVLRIIFPLTAVLILTGCGSQPVKSPEKPAVVLPTNVLTGLPGINGPLLFVKVDDTESARPQIGLEDADVLYIEQVEGGLTRIAAVFSNKLPALIGPVRSARISDIDLMANYGRPGLAFSGAQSKFLPVLAAANIEDIGADHEPPSIFSRDSHRTSPTNMVVDPKALLAKSISREKRPIGTAKSVGWQFGPLPKTGTAIKSATMRWPAARYQARWSSSENRWLLYVNGKADLGANGSILGSPTFIIQKVSITPSIYHDHVGNFTPFSNTVGSGTGYLLRDGEAVPILWKRPTRTAPTTWTLKDGTIAYFHTGQIWIALTDQEPTFEFLAAPSPTASTIPTAKSSNSK